MVSAGVDADFERRLAAALEPARGFVLAQALFHLLDSGIHEALRERTSVRALAERFEHDERRLAGFLAYLAGEGFVDLDAAGAVALTRAGSELGEFAPWYRLLVGGYARSLLDLPAALARGGAYAPRDPVQVAVGSCGISRFDALPVIRELSRTIRAQVGVIVDVGCGDASVLAELCRAEPATRGVGVELLPAGVAEARRNIEALGLSHLVEVRLGGVMDPVALGDDAGAACYLAAFVLHEVLEQAGEVAVCDWLSALLRPGDHAIVVEVDHRPDDAALLRSGLGRAYYNPYYLIHQITEQRLEPRAFWEELFARAGLQVVAVETPDPAVDSTGLELGYLLRRRA